MAMGGMAAGSSQSMPERGTIVDSLRVDNTPKETYALYLPTGYDPAVPAPIVFIFDPAARGRHAVEFFIPAAERYGYILVCSNQTRNGPYDRNFEIANRLFTQVFSRFQIDPKRVYTAGFSGGARLASSIALLTRQVQGVVACGAGMASSPAYFQVSEPDNFSYAGIVGNVDMNYREMVNTRNWLNRLKVSNECFEFAGDHQWPPPEELVLAFDWLQMEAFRKGLIPADTQQVQAIFEKYVRRARDLEATGELLRAFDQYSRVLRTFGPYVGLDSIASRKQQLAETKPYKKARKAWEASQAQEDTLVSRYSSRMYRDIALHNSQVRAWWEREISKLEGQRAKADPERRQMLERVLNNIWAMAHSRATDDAMTPTLPEKAFCLDLCIRTKPSVPLAYFLQMQNYLKGNDPDAALDYLEKLLGSGFSNFEWIRNSKTLEPLRGMARYVEIMNQKGMGKN